MGSGCGGRVWKQAASIRRIRCPQSSLASSTAPTRRITCACRGAGGLSAPHWLATTGRIHMAQQRTLSPKKPVRPAPAAVSRQLSTRPTMSLRSFGGGKGCGSRYNERGHKAGLRASSRQLSTPVERNKQIAHWWQEHARRDAGTCRLAWHAARLAPAQGGCKPRVRASARQIPASPHLVLRLAAAADALLHRLGHVAAVGHGCWGGLRAEGVRGGAAHAWIVAGAPSARRVTRESRPDHTLRHPSVPNHTVCLFCGGVGGPGAQELKNVTLGGSRAHLRDDAGGLSGF